MDLVVAKPIQVGKLLEAMAAAMAGGEGRVAGAA
jgi:hypothetical protein